MKKVLLLLLFTVFTTSFIMSCEVDTSDEDLIEEIQSGKDEEPDDDDPDN